MRCIQCRRPFSLLEVTVQVDAHDDESAELCEQCDATYPEQLRPSLGGAVAFLRRADGENSMSYTTRKAGKVLQS